MFQIERVRVGEHCVDVRRTADASGKKVVLMIHGIGVSGRYLMPLARVLAKEHDVHVIDLPGYGRTPRPDHALSPAELANVVAEYAKTAHLTNMIIMGQSMGCQTAAHVARRYPEVCERLVLVGPTVDKRERHLYLQAFRLLQDTFHEPLKANLIIFSDYLRMGPIRFLKTARLMLRDRIEETLQAVTMPVCIVRGEQDHIVSREWAAYLRSINKQADMREIPGGPHNIQYTNPRELLAICDDFLKK